MGKDHKKHEWTEERSERFIKSVKNRIEERYANFLKVVSNSIQEYNNKEDSIVLDIGCGPGYMLFELKKIVPPIKIIGVDASDLMIKTANKKANELEIKNFEFKKGFAEKIPMNDNHCDLVTCFNSLHDFKDWKQTLNESYRVLKQRGLFFLHDRSGVYPKWKFVSVAFRIGVKRAFRYYKTRHSWLDPDTVKEFMIENGFQILCLEKKEHYIIIGQK